MRRIAFLLLFVSGLLGASSSLATDLIVINAKVITVDRSRPQAEAFAVENGRFIAVGSNAQIRRLAGPSTQVIDLHGKTVTPGFNDPHLHPRPLFSEDSPYFIPWLGPEEVKDMDDLIQVLKKKAERTPKGTMVSGIGYEDSKLGRHPNRHDLDKVSTEHPIAIRHRSGHITVVNSYVLQAAGVTKDTPDPPGGAFDRDPDGTPNGVVRESARRVLGKALDSPQIPWNDQIGGTLRDLREYSSHGITSAGVAGAGPDQIRLYQAVRDAGSPVRLGVMVLEPYFADVQKLGLKSGFGDDRLRLTAIKVFHGNSLSGRTCWLSEAYSDRPGYFGIPPARSQEDLDKAFAEMHDAGWQIATHSNGDREIDMVLTAIERAQAKNPRPDARHRIEHASVMNQALLDRAKRDGVILVFHSYMWEHGDKLESYGEKRLAMMHPFRTALDMGIPVAAHSDSPVSAADPLLRIGDMVTRKGSNGKVYGGNQRISVQEAIEAYTLGPAYATFEEKSKGSITPGKLADFAVLRADPRKVDPDAIKDIVVDSTYLGGELVYSAPPGAKAVRSFRPLLGAGDGDEDDDEENSSY